MNVEEYESSIRVAGGEQLRQWMSGDALPRLSHRMQAQLMAVLSLARTSVVTETVFENRFMHANELKRMGAE